MSHESDSDLFRFNGAIHVTPFHKLNEVLETIIEKVFALRRLEGIYQGLAQTTDSSQFLEQVLDKLNVCYELSSTEMSYIPPQGPTIVVANHPFGAIEGIILAQLLGKVRADVKILANYHLQRIPEIKGLFISVDPFGGKKSAIKNRQPLREAIHWVKQGGLLAIFPAGEVSHWHLHRAKSVDPRWNPAVGRIVRLTEAQVIPVYFSGSNSFIFQMLGLLHPRLRTAMLPRELLNKASRTIHIRIGKPIPFAKLKALKSKDDIVEYLRLRTYMLQDIPEDATLSRLMTLAGVRRARTSIAEPITTGPSPALLAAELTALPMEQRLIQSGAMEVYYCTADQIHWVLRDIGRLRETSFREIGEGTGKSIDIDIFDSHYLHLILWNAEAREIIGAYRMGLADKILSRFGKKGLYTYTLFKYNQRVLETLNPAIELGRSFVRREYQRSFAPLLLLWRGIGQFVVRHPHYRVLFGPVSISNQYRALSRQLLVDFLKAHSLQGDLARHVKPRHPFRGNAGRHWDDVNLIRMTDIEELSELVAQIERDNKGVPILLKQYLKLGGRLLGFNVDSHFNDALDGLIMVDLMATNPRLLRHYMGREAAERFLAYHQAAANSYLHAS